MHGSFNTQAVQEFYSAFDGLSAPIFSEGEHFDFSRTAKSVPKPQTSVKKKTPKAEQKLEKAEQVLEMAEALYKKDSTEENYEKVCLAEALLRHTEIAFAEELKSLENELRYSESYDAMDFTRCVRPDGSSYGSRGECRKGTKAAKQTGDATPKKKQLSPDEKWMEDRLKTLKSLKGKSKEELLSILSQHKRIHGMSAKDTITDLKSGILGAIHGNDSPSEIIEKRQARVRQMERQREMKRKQEEERSAIDQLSKMLPKGEQISDSLGNIVIATGG